MPSAALHTAEIAEDYLAAWKRKDVDAIARILHPDVHLKSPLADVTGRESFVMMVRKIFLELEDVIVRARFASEAEAMIVYDFVLKQPIGVTRTANLMTFEGGLIRSVELFFDARPFEKSADKTSVSS
jgi:SnoaL-like domain